METPLTNAAKRGDVFFEEPMMEAFPSRIDFLPNSMTSPGISSYFVEATNLPTYSVRPGALGKSFRGALPALPIESERRVDPSTLREVLPKSRLNKVHPLFRTLASGCSTVSMEISGHHAGPGPT